jgi:calcineurin-like phosphoesterase
MKILYVAEVVGKAGMYALKKVLPGLQKSEQIDFTLVCADSATGGNGLGRNHAGYIHKLGADAITTGDCCFFKKDLVENWSPYVLRPANFGKAENREPPPDVPGYGWRVFKVKGRSVKAAAPQSDSQGSPQSAPYPRIAVAVLLGSNFSRLRADSPFSTLQPLLEKLKSQAPFVVLDFHALATGEKRTLFAAAAGLCTAVIGSHNRVQTADEAVVNGTAHISDAGRTGSAESVGGNDSSTRIREYLTGIPEWTKEAWDKCELQGVIIEADDVGKALSIKRIRIPVPAGNSKMPDTELPEPQPSPQGEG